MDQPAAATCSADRQAEREERSNSAAPSRTDYIILIISLSPLKFVGQTHNDGLVAHLFATIQNMK